MALCITCGGDKQTSCISGVSSKDDPLLENSVVVLGSFRKDDLLLTVSPAVSRTLGVIQSSFVREGKNSSEAKLQREKRLIGPDWEFGSGAAAGWWLECPLGSC